MGLSISGDRLSGKPPKRWHRCLSRIRRYLFSLFPEDIGRTEGTGGQWKEM
jgi:hypothetical protein